MLSSHSSNSFNFAQVSFSYKALPRLLELITINTLEAFIADVLTVQKKLEQGRIASVRQLELELNFAGRVCLPHLKFLVEKSISTAHLLTR